MIATQKRKAIFLLHQEGMSAREIARRLGVGRNTVRAIIKQEGATPHLEHADKQRIDPDLQAMSASSSGARRAVKGARHGYRGT